VTAQCWRFLLRANRLSLRPKKRLPENIDDFH